MGYCLIWLQYLTQYKYISLYSIHLATPILEDTLVKLILQLVEVMVKNLSMVEDLTVLQSVYKVNAFLLFFQCISFMLQYLFHK